MIDGLIAGKIHGQPTQRTSKAGKPFALCKVRVVTGAEDSIFVSVIAFDSDPVNAILAMNQGDSVALSGNIKPGVWTDNQGNAKPTLDMTAHQVLTAYHVTRKRRAVAKEDGPDGRTSKPVAMPAQPEFDDDLNF
ncbi:MAG: single-stranded DNA-binding protein [Rhodoferax sp.]|uniref:single-stranded DNA-binding protein n=1 Tax=Rhodoferax sp. TaxID=50421 RepID=UPI00261D6428|nr:single-stranded DNA-binding protein [Rhodoferax sp.]MDD2883076.1 single-stranded DNA-binding protein [Rhodoferax sp.]